MIKILRTLRRDYFGDSFDALEHESRGINGAAGGINTAIGIFGSFGLGASGSLTAAGLIGLGSTMMAITGMLIGMHRLLMNRNEKGSCAAHILKGESNKLLGPGRQVTLIENTQFLIDGLTKKYRRSAILPEKVHKRLEPYLSDAQEALRQVQVFDQNNQPQTQLTFLRQCYDANGVLQNTPAASLVTSFDVAAQASAVVANINTSSPSPKRVPPVKYNRQEKRHP